MAAHNNDGPRKQGAQRWIGGLVGFVIGFLIGAVVAGGIWLVTFARALDGQSTLNIPGFITVDQTADTADTVLGPLFVFAPLIVAIVGTVVGALLRPPRPRGVDFTPATH
ncbi:MAG TPA: hypothetical protein VNT53_09155 [Pseudolysinimonas sp.]|nr:hypothetical protein [Pseudolysinimonas sp.]